MVASPDLAAISRIQPRRDTALAQYLSTHGKPGPTLKPASFVKEGSTTEEPGIISRIFDYLDQPGRAVRNTVDAFTSDDPNKSGMDEFLGDLGTAGKAVGGAALGILTPDVTPGFDIAGMDKRFNKWNDQLNPYVSGSKLLDNLGWDTNKDSNLGNKIGHGVTGFAAEVALDPLTYGTFGLSGLIKGALKGGAKGLEAASAADRLTLKAAGKPEAFVRREASHIPKQSPAEMAMQGGHVPTPSMPVKPPKLNTGTPNPDPFSWGPAGTVLRILNDPESMNAMVKAKRSDDGWRAAQKRWGRDPDVEQAHLDNAVSKAEWHDTMRQHKLAKRGKVTDGKGNFSQVSVTRVLDGIERGEIPRWGPRPAEATGVARDIAVREADNAIDATLKKGTRTEFNPANQANLYNRLYDATEEIFRTEPDLIQKFGNKAGEVKTNSPRVRTARRVMARAMLRTSEDHLTSLGKVPQYWDGTGLRLSDVLEEIGLEANDELATKVLKAWQTKNIRHVDEPVVKEAITRALARRPLHMSSMLEDFSTLARQQADHIFDSYPYNKALQKFEDLKNHAAVAARAGGATEAEIKAIKDAVAHVINVDKLPADQFMDTLGKRLVEAFEAGRIDRKALGELNRKIVAIAGYAPTDLVGKVTGKKYLDSIALRFSTYFGRNTQMKRLSEDLFTWGEMNAIHRAHWLRNMIRQSGNKPEVTFQAFKIAQGMADETVFADPAAHKLASQMKEYFESVLGSSGLRDLPMKGKMEGSVAVRSQMVMDDVNKQLEAIGSQFKFTNKAGVKDDFLGNTHDFSGKGDKSWIDSWVLANPKGNKDPMSFLYDIDLAVERTVKEYSLIDEFVTHFGVKRGSKAYNPKLHKMQMPSRWGNRIEDDIYFTPQDRDGMARLLKDLDEGLWKPKSKLVQHYSRGLRAWKTGVTIYYPSHHIRNMIGDLHLMWWAGHNDPRNFIRARKVLNTQRQRYRGALNEDRLDSLQRLIDKDALEWAGTEGGDIIIRQGGHSLTADQIYVAAHQHGLLLDANKYEDIFGEPPLSGLMPSKIAGKQVSEETKMRLANPLGGNVHELATGIAEYREHYVRLSHFIGAINKGLKKNRKLEDVLQEAAEEVRKWHPDGRDLTHFEQKTRYAIPFYSWTRKALPLIVQAAVQRPSKVLYYPRAIQAMQDIAGIEGTTMMDPFPDNQLFPDWIRARGIGPISDADEGGWFSTLTRDTVDEEGNPTGYGILNPSNPFMDVIESIGGLSGSPKEVGRSVFDSMTPAIKIPGELAFDTTFSGAPISASKRGGQGHLNYLLNQIPAVAGANNVAEIDFRTLKPKEMPESREKGRDIQALLNYLTAAGIRGTGPYVKTAEFEASERANNG